MKGIVGADPENVDIRKLRGGLEPFGTTDAIEIERNVPGSIEITMDDDVAHVPHQQGLP
jgi:hypothetical protein